jgi:hypothetical protein
MTKFIVTIFHDLSNSNSPSKGNFKRINATFLPTKNPTVSRRVLLEEWNDNPVSTRRFVSHKSHRMASHKTGCFVAQ